MVVAALLALGSGTAAAGVIAFDDAYASLDDGGNPATYYSSEGVTIGGDFFGLAGGIGNGDPGDWSLDGTNGSAFLGCNDGNSCSPTFTFASPVDQFSLDIGLANDWAANFTVSGYLDANLVDSQTLNFTDTGTTGGTWNTFTLNGSVDQVVVSSSFSKGFAYGIDNVQFASGSAAPEPASISLMLFGSVFLGVTALRRYKRTAC